MNIGIENALANINNEQYCLQLFMLVHCALANVNSTVCEFKNVLVNVKIIMNLDEYML